MYSPVDSVDTNPPSIKVEEQGGSDQATCKHCGRFVAPHIGTKGTVLIYKVLEYDISPARTQVKYPGAKIQVTITSTLGPVVEAVARYYSAIQTDLRIYIYDEADNTWELKGRYKQVVEDNDKVQFTPHDTYGHVLRILVSNF